MGKCGDKLGSEGGGGGLGVSLGSNIRLLWGYFTLIGGKLRILLLEGCFSGQFWELFEGCLMVKLESVFRQN
jgi:hypothetical protein